MKVKIIFGSEVGTTKYVAELLKTRFESHHFTVSLYQVGIDGYQPDVSEYDLILFGSPTYFDGQLQSDMAAFTGEFHENLISYDVAVFALGDSGYPHFCGAAEVLEKWVAQNGGTLVVPTLKIDGYPQDFDNLTEWVNQIVKAISS